MLQFVGIPAILAAWTLPALFLCALAGVLGYAILRPVYRAWAAAFDASGRWVRRQALRVAEALASRSYAYAVRHGRDRR